MRYQMISAWLMRNTVSETDIYLTDFTSKELQFIAEFNKQALAKTNPELVQYFKGVL